MSFRQRRREQREAREIKENQIQNQLPPDLLAQPVPPRAAANDQEVPTFVQPTIIYQHFGNANFYIPPDVINLFHNHQDIRLYGKPTTIHMNTYKLF